MEWSFMIWIFVTLFNYAHSYNVPESFELMVNLQNTHIFTTNDKFLSVALDTSVVAGKLKNFNMSDDRLQKLVSYLAPAYLRIGGNMADRLFFSEQNQSQVDINQKTIFDMYICKEFENCSMDFPNFTMSGHDWISINKFAKYVGLTILFDLNCLIRNEDGSWNSKNAQELINFSDQNKFDIHWQLGNEPDSFEHVFNYYVSASQLAKDFSVLKKILVKYPRYQNSLLVGPDVTRPRPNHKQSSIYFKTFLQNSKHIFGAISWHQYYLNGRKAVMEDFLNPETFQLLEQQLDIVIRIINETGFKDTPVWLSETSSAYGGGAPGLSNTFVGSFLWLDKLGLSAKYGLETVIRQSLFSGYYALIDKNYNPTPDWWLSVIYKTLVAEEVLQCDVTGSSKTVRLYCHCAKSLLHIFHGPAITVFGVNINGSTAYVDVKNVKPVGEEAVAYIFTNPDLTSKKIFLNENILELSTDTLMPDILPEIVDSSKPLKMPPYSLVFWVIPVVRLCSAASVIIV